MTQVETVHRIDTDFGGRTNAVYVLEGADRVLLVDTGAATAPGRYLLPFLAEHGIGRIDVVLNTHADIDHIGGNEAVGEAFPDSLAVCHVLDRPWIDDVGRLVDERYDEYAVLGLSESAADKAAMREVARARPTGLAVCGGEVVRLAEGREVEILHVPGHSHGHLAVWDPASGSLVIGDAALSDGLYRTDGTPAFPPTYRYVDDYVATLQKLAGFDAHHLFTSHYPTMSGQEVGAFLDRSAAFVADLEASLRAALSSAAGGLTLRESLDAVAPDLGPWEGADRLPLKFPVLGHLERLEATGKVQRSERAEGIVFSWTA